MRQQSRRNDLPPSCNDRRSSRCDRPGRTGRPSVVGRGCPGIGCCFPADTAVWTAANDPDTGTVPPSGPRGSERCSFVGRVVGPGRPDPPPSCRAPPWRPRCVGPGWSPGLLPRLRRDSGKYCDGRRDPAVQPVPAPPSARPAPKQQPEGETPMTAALGSAGRRRLRWGRERDDDAERQGDPGRRRRRGRGIGNRFGFGFRRGRCGDGWFGVTRFGLARFGFLLLRASYRAGGGVRLGLRAFGHSGVGGCGAAVRIAGRIGAVRAGIR